VLGTSNIAEGLRGYMTKYDCSSADLNPIGGINKTDLKAFLKYYSSVTGLAVLSEIANAHPSAELRPQEEGKNQVSEEEMDMTFPELDEYGKLRKIEKAGPV
jgi:NAD+ synthase (glutamine-hydrolysing)